MDTHVSFVKIITISTSLFHPCQELIHKKYKENTHFLYFFPVNEKKDQRSLRIIGLFPLLKHVCSQPAHYAYRTERALPHARAATCTHSAGEKKRRVMPALLFEKPLLTRCGSAAQSSFTIADLRITYFEVDTCKFIHTRHDKRREMVKQGKHFGEYFQ